MTVTPFFPFENQDIAYPLSMNVDLTQPGKVLPAFDMGELAGSGDMLHYPSPGIVTKAPSGNPRTYFSCNRSVFYEEGGVRTTDQTFADAIQGMAIVDNGSGTPVLLVTFGTGTVNGNAVRSLSTDTTPWTTNTGATKMTAWFLKTAGPNLYANTGAGASGTELARTVLGDNQVSICPPDSDPTLAATYSIGEPVGPPEWGLTGMAAHQGRIVVARPDGFWIRDRQDKEFINKLDRIPGFSPHGANGKGMFEGEGGTWYPTYDGRLYRFDGYSMYDETPMRDLELPRDMKLGRVESGVDLGGHGLVVLSSGSENLDGKHAADAIGLRVFKEDGGVITELTSSVCDGKLTTGGAMGAWGAATTDYLVFGSRVKLGALGVRVTRSANAAVQSFTQPECLNGAGAWTSLGTIRDGSVLGTSGVSLALTGFPASAGESLIGWTALNGWDLAELDTYNGISGLYWYRVRSATTTGMTAGTEIDEVFVVVARPPLPNEGILAASNNYTGRDREGLLTRVLEFRREGGRIKWSQRYNVPAFGGVTGIAVTPAPGTISNSGSRVLLLGRFSQWQIAESRSRDASTTRHARCVQFASDTPGAMLAAVGLRLGDPRTLTRLGRVQWVRKYAQPEDRVQLVVIADNRHVWNAGVRRGTPAVWDLTAAPLGPAWEWDLYVLQDDNAQTDAVAPYGVLGLVEHEDVGQPYVSLAQHPGFAVEGEEAA